jgi:hypothetical protein
MLCAKTDTTVGFDPLWYGLRGDLVLLDHGSVYHSLGLVSAVHYFPKLYEMLLLPVSGIGSASVISGVSLMMFVLTAATAHALVRRLGVKSWEVRIAAIAACVTLPAIANTALDPKPDTLAALLVLIGWLNASEFVETRKLAAAFWSASSLILATQAKLSVLPFATVVALAAGWLVLRDMQRPAAQDRAPDRRTAIAVFALAIVVTGFVTARTIVLAGMPTIGPDAFFHLWTSIGFELKPPAGTLSWTSVPDWSDIPRLAVDLLFRPQLLEHIIVAWTGNVWLWCGIVVLAASLLRRFEQIPPNATLAMGKPLMLSGLLVMFGIGYGVRGSDGNYFIAALVPAIIIGTNSFSRALPLRSMTRTIGAVCFFVFVAFQATYSFLSASWAPGTHALDTNFLHRGIHDFRKHNRALMMHSGLGKIEQRLRHLHRSSRVLDCLDESLSLRLPARVRRVARRLSRLHRTRQHRIPHCSQRRRRRPLQPLSGGDAGHSIACRRCVSNVDSRHRLHDVRSFAIRRSARIGRAGSALNQPRIEQLPREIARIAGLARTRRIEAAARANRQPDRCAGGQTHLQLDLAA